MICRLGRLLAAVGLAWAWIAAVPAAADEVVLHFFWSDTCPHCREARPEVERLAAEWSWLRLESLEVSRSPDNARLYRRLARLAGGEAQGVPAFLFCGEMHVGFAPQQTPALLRQRLEACHVGTAAPPPPPEPLRLPLIGPVSPEDLSLPVLTLLLGGLDAFNPCAFFVLLFLLGLMTHARSRGRMLLVGGVFVAVSGVVYFLFMAAWLNLFLLTGGLRAVTLAAGGLAVVMGGLNIKDYFLWGRGPSLVIPAAAKPRLYQRMRALVAAPGLPAVLAGTLLLAIAANAYELLCTAGFPMVYTRILTLHALTPLQHLLYLGLYAVVYVLPLLAIVAGFVIALGGRRLSEAWGRRLKLVSGLMMTALGLLLAAAPDRLDDPLVAAGLPLGAVAAALLISACGAGRRRPG